MIAGSCRSIWPAWEATIECRDGSAELRRSPVRAGRAQRSPRALRQLARCRGGGGGANPGSRGDSDVAPDSQVGEGAAPGRRPARYASGIRAVPAGAGAPGTPADSAPTCGGVHEPAGPEDGPGAGRRDPGADTGREAQARNPGSVEPAVG